MKKILVLHRYPPGQVIGTNASFIEFLKELSKSGFKTFYLSFKEKEGQDLKEDIENLEFVNLPFYFKRGSNFDKKIKTYLWILLTPFYVRKLQRQYNLDLVYCDDSVPFYGFLSKIVSTKSKVVIRLGDLQTGYALADDHPRLFKIVLKVETMMWKKVDGIIAISNPFKKFIIEQGVKEEKVKVVRESVNLDGVNFNNVSVPDSKIISFHGSIVKCKGLKTLVKAFKIVKEEIPEAKLRIAGGGGEEKNIKEFVEKEGVQDVEFTGWYDHNKLENILKDVQIAVVMRSPNMANNFVVTTCLLENWKYKKPVLVPDLEAFKEVIEDGESGVFFKVGDEEDLAEKIKLMINKKYNYESLTNNGFKKAKDVFNQKVTARNMVNNISRV